MLVRRRRRDHPSDRCLPRRRHRAVARLLAELVTALDDPTVVAAGPSCTRTFGPQRVESPTDPAAAARFAADWDGDGVTDVGRLGPVCAAVRRDALTAVGGPVHDLLPYPALAARGASYWRGMRSCCTGARTAPCARRRPRRRERSFPRCCSPGTTRRTSRTA
ncbi:hypothetical protein ACFQX7_00965 [Luedemannella flava]